MSKFSEKLGSLGQSAPARMGFGVASAREKTPVMLVIGRAADAKSGEGVVDAVLTPANATAPGKEEGNPTWGVLAGSGEPVDTAKLKEVGCQLALIESGDCPASALLEEDIAFGTAVEPGLPDQRIRAIEDAPFEFLVYKPSAVASPITVDAMMELQELVSSYSKHIFLEVSTIPEKSDLDVLKQLPISALIVDLEKIPADKVKELRETISKLEPRKQKSERTPMVPAAGRNAADSNDDGGGYEEDDEDWDDE